jgi:hypothetical protein
MFTVHGIVFPYGEEVLMVAQVTVNDVVYVKAREFHPKGTCHAHKNFTRICTNVKDDLKSVRP